MSNPERIELVSNIQTDEVSAAILAWTLETSAIPDDELLLGFPSAEYLLSRNATLANALKSLTPRVLEKLEIPEDDNTVAAFLAGSLTLVEVLSQIAQERCDLDQAGMPPSDQPD